MPFSGRRPLPSPALPRIAAILAVAAWFAWMAVYQVDDAYIVYRYATNLAHGEGFVFNPGERVEGVSCFLWTLLLVPFAAAGLPLPVVAPFLTALAGLAAVLVIPSVSARMRGRDRPGAIDVAAAALLAAHPAFAYWSVGGLETVPYALLLLLALRAGIEETESGHGRRSALWLGLATLVRPEAPLLAGALALARLLHGPGRGWRERIAGTMKFAATVAGFFVPFLLFRRWYFGDWLPNTYYAKAGAGWDAALHDGSVYIGRWLASLAPGFGDDGPLAAAIGFGLFLGLLAFGLPRPRLRPAALLLCALGLAVLLEGGDWMVLHRFWVPGLPALFLLLAAAVSAALQAAPRLGPWLAVLGVVAACSSLVAGVLARNGPRGLRVNAAGYRLAHLQVADFLRARARPDDRVALMDIGMIGHVTGLSITDISGLTEPSIARSPGGFLAKTYPVDLFLKASPRFFVLVDGFPIDTAIRDHPEFARRYRPVFERNHRANWTPPGDYTLRVYERVDAGAERPPG